VPPARSPDRARLNSTSYLPDCNDLEALPHRIHPDHDFLIIVAVIMPIIEDANNNTAQEHTKLIDTSVQHLSALPSSPSK